MNLCTYSCPNKTRYYEIEAIQIPIVYNQFGDHDTNGLLYVLKKDAERIRKGALRNFCQGVPQPYEEVMPLVIRANVGEKIVVTFIDWIEITLHNLFNADNPIPYFDYPRVPLDKEHKPSMRVSINPQFLNYDPICDSGINVGFNNQEQTVGVGESKKYLWYADKEYGSCIIQSFGDMRNHRYHGLFGAIIIEPAGAIWYKNFSHCKTIYDEEAAIVAPGIERFRECVVLVQNGIRMLDKDNILVKTAAGEDGDDVDAEDTGEKGYNYRSERFANRLNKNPKISKVFSSKIHGDPATPVFKAYTGERVIFRTMMPADKPRNVGFCIHGHTWKQQPEDALSRVIPLQGAVSIGNTFDMELENNASDAGDYLYRSGSFKWDVEYGMWGIFRVVKQGILCKCNNLCKKAFACICITDHS